MKSFQPLIYAVDAENITIKGEGTLDGQGKKWWMEFFRVMIDLKDNGMRDINKYQPMWDAQNDTTAIYAETNKIMSALCSVVFSALRSFSLFVARR